MTDSTISANGLQVRYRDSGGTGPAVLLLHGIGGSLELWAAQFVEANHGMRLIALDLPGHGLSDFGPHPFTPKTFAAFVWKFADALGLINVHLAGNSLGGAICVQMLAQQPARVQTVLLAAAANLGRDGPVPFRLMTLPVLALATGLNLLLEQYVNPVSLYSVYLVAVILVALRWGTGPSVLASVLSLLTFDFLFVAPRFTLAMARPGDVVSALVFFLASIVIGQLLRITRRQYEALQVRAERISVLEEMSKELLALPPLELLIGNMAGQAGDLHDSVSVLRTTVLDDVGQTTVRNLSKAVTDPIAVLFGSSAAGLRIWARSQPELALTPEETAVAEWTFGHGEPAGAGTETLASVGFYFIPMKSRDQTIGVVGVKGDYQSLLPEQRHLIGAIANLASLSVARWVSA